STPFSLLTVQPRDYDVIILPVFEFSFRYQRPQHLAVQFARHGHRVFWVSPGQPLPPDATETYQALPLQENLWEVRLKPTVPNVYLRSLDPHDVSVIGMALKKLCRDWAVSECCVVVQLPFWRQVGLELQRDGAKLVYDCMDNWDTFPGLGEFTRSEEALLPSECDTLLVTAQALHDKYSAKGHRPVLVRNGVDFDFFSAPASVNRVEANGAPIAGYFGAIADWFDYDLLFDVASSRPQYQFVLIGGRGLEDTISTPEIAKLRTLPNVRFLGHKPYERIPAHLAGFDVCLIPFVLNHVTRATDPVKLYEYFSQGKPVVATGMTELEQCGDLVYIGRDAADFASQLDRAIAEDCPDLRRRRTEFAASAAWTRRYDLASEAIRCAFPAVSILIVTHNSAEYIGPCLDSIRRHTHHPNYEIVVVDNFSEDGTRDRLAAAAAADPHVHVSLEPSNLGFAVANNRAARLATGEYFILLNADTMVTAGWVQRLLRPFLRDPEVGVVVPVTNFAGNEARIHVNYHTASQMEEFAALIARERAGGAMDLEVAPLFCAAVPRAVWERVGELDEGFDLGMFEDDDFALRVLQARRRVVTAEDCFIHHFGQGSFGKLPREKYDEIFERNRKRFEQKWRVKWEPHRQRRGVRTDAPRFTPAEFLRE
ncbi:MAG: glycosyltransferase, partial [Bryobacteraceae bacterium]